MWREGAVEGYNAVRGLQNICCEKRLKDLLNLGKQRLRGRLTATCLYLEGRYRDDRPVLGRATWYNKGSDRKLWLGRFRLYIRATTKHVFASKTSTAQEQVAQRGISFQDLARERHS